jgi:hypothetical protein
MSNCRSNYLPQFVYYVHIYSVEQVLILNMKIFAAWRKATKTQLMMLIIRTIYPHLLYILRLQELFRIYFYYCRRNILFVNVHGLLLALSIMPRMYQLYQSHEYFNAFVKIVKFLLLTISILWGKKVIKLLKKW